MDAADLRTVHQGRALWLSTIAFTICFAVWTIFSIIGIRIKQELGLNDTQFGLLVGTPILSGSLIRLAARHLDRSIWRTAGLHRRHAGRGGRDLPADLGAHLSRVPGGGACSSASPAARSRSASPTFRAFIRQASRAPRSASSAPAMSAPPLTKFVAPFVLVAYGWQTVAQVWALAIGLMGIVFWFFSEEDPVVRARRAKNEKPTQRMARARAAEEHSGLAFRAVLFLRVRRLRRAGAVAAAISHQGLRRRHQDRRHGGCDVLAAGQRVPGLWRASLRSLSARGA